MQIVQAKLKPISAVELTVDEQKILQWMRRAKWEPQIGAKEPIPYKVKVPEFFSGVRLYKTQAGPATGAGAMGALDLLVKKLQFQSVISRQELYPVVTQGAARFLSLKKADLNNLGVGAEDSEDD